MLQERWGGHGKAYVHTSVDNVDSELKRIGGFLFGATQVTTHIIHVPSMSPWGLCINSFNPHNNPPSRALISPLFRWGTWASERLTDLPLITQLGCGRTGIQTRGEPRGGLNHDGVSDLVISCSLPSTWGLLRDWTIWTMTVDFLISFICIDPIRKNPFCPAPDWMSLQPSYLGKIAV